MQKNNKFPCLICGKIFKREPLQIKNGENKFCSRKCSGKWKAKNLIGKENPHWKGGDLSRKCLTCNKNFIFPRALAKTKKFCSRYCLGIWCVIHARKKDTRIELLIEKELIRRKISYQKQVPIPEAKTIVDFLLPSKIIIYCDGDYWHNKKEQKIKDLRQNKALKTLGYTVYRFWEKEIEYSEKTCLSKIELIEKEIGAKRNIMFVINQTPFLDFDIIGIGDLALLSALSKTEKHYHLIRKSKFGGIPILIIDTVDSVKFAKQMVSELNNQKQTHTLTCMNTTKKLYKNKQGIV